MENEVWKSIINYEGLYEISNYGKIKSYPRQGSCGKILKSYTEKDGHLRTYLYKNNVKKAYLIHRLVLETFVGPCPIGMESCHNDGNPGNNFIRNLRYDTSKNNMQDQIKHKTRARGHNCGASKLNEIKVRVIKRLLEDNYLTIIEIAKIFKVCRQHIYNIKKKKIWKHIHQETE